MKKFFILQVKPSQAATRQTFNSTNVIKLTSPSSLNGFIPLFNHRDLHFDEHDSTENKMVQFRLNQIESAHLKLNRNVLSLSVSDCVANKLRFDAIR